MSRLTHDRCCQEIACRTEQLRTVVTSGADLSGTVPTTPDWSLEQLIRHVGGSLRWAAQMVRTGAEDELDEDQVPDFDGPAQWGDPGALDAWLAESGELIVGALRDAGPDAEVWSWAGVRNAGFWSRRMAHELIVHGADAALAAGLPFEVAPDAAADAIDEWLEIVEWAQRTLPEDTVHQLRGPRRTILLHATDAGEEADAERSGTEIPPSKRWGRLIVLAEDGVSWSRGHEKATVTLRGPLTSVLLAFYRRLPLDAPELEVLGEQDVLELWLTHATFG
ncbi:maleylpyruvate isomerase N-terminal domain-containing protein [Streptomyces sp. CHD11]|uniref:maleylpyruvate isomerase N-terminal domain-containing protein n=1 Tax=Streptomyces sp. CHD11 TaxID=2741325 RepID=UPI001BFC13E2|nr:maleylpyruvate isomerase N-terminal domain-containing protein [Streptomyces sp. CHD11]MBT3152874.1 maleylpyruvate isomerase N-terminal domain-containing protein [Streptomyces sp. CHD11]